MDNGQEIDDDQGLLGIVQESAITQDSSLRKKKELKKIWSLGQFSPVTYPKFFKIFRIFELTKIIENLP